jgi:predicted secreted protein
MGKKQGRYDEKQADKESSSNIKLRTEDVGCRDIKDGSGIMRGHNNAELIRASFFEVSNSRVRVVIREEAARRVDFHREI